MSKVKLLVATLFYLLSQMPAYADVTLHDTQGHAIPFNSLQGKWVFINYWASWCSPCLEEIPELNEFYEAHKAGNVALFGVNYESLTLEQQKPLISEVGIRYPSLSRDPAKLLRLGDIRGVPVTFVFNPQGRLVKALYGPQTMRDLTEIMATA